jgi:Holliday junction resolvasome RuvABC endonuclease subunit
MAIYPNTRGFAFVLFEGPLSPVDWQAVEIKRGRDKNRQCLEAISRLFGRYQPDVLVLQHTGEGGTRRALRIRDLNEAIEVLAETQGIPVAKYSRAQVRACFAETGIVTKPVMAEAIAKHIPVFGKFVPPLRKIWMSEDARAGIFDAIALVLSYFSRGNREAAQQASKVWDEQTPG